MKRTIAVLAAMSGLFAAGAAIASVKDEPEDTDRVMLIVTVPVDTMQTCETSAPEIAERLSLSLMQPVGAACKRRPLTPDPPAGNPPAGSDTPEAWTPPISHEGLPGVSRFEPCKAEL